MPTNSLPVLALALTTFAGTAMAQQAQPVKTPTPRIDLLTAPAPTSIYKDQVVVKVFISTHDQLHEALHLAESSWSERPGLGFVSLQIRQDRLDALKAIGLSPTIVIADLEQHANERWAQVIERERLDITNKAGAHTPVAIARGSGSSHDEAWFSNYKQLTDIYAYMDLQVATHPDLITKFDFGDTVEGRDMFAFTITAPDAPGNLASDRPVIIWNGAQHAREWVSPMTVTYIASRMLEDSSTDPEVAELLQSVRFVIVPVLNPDGYLYSWTDERFWRKNRADNPGTSFDGVDLNRNWGVEFGGAGTSTDPSSDIYHGPHAFSEPETTALSDLALSYGDDLAAHIDFHTYSQLILWPLGYESGLVTPEPDRSFFESLSGDMSDLIMSISGEFYDPIQSWMLYPAAGTCSDWFYAGAGVPSFTVELRPDSGGFDGFDPSPDIILPTAQENWEAAKLFAVRTTQPFSLNHTSVAHVEANTPIDLTLTVGPGISDVDSGAVTMSYRIGESGAYTSIVMSELGSSQFGATIPAVSCGQTVEYYFNAVSVDGISINYPAGGESNPESSFAQITTITLEDTMETDSGWTVGDPNDSATTGVWELADPESTSAQPENDHTPSGTLCWVTDGEAGESLGSFDIDGGATTLTSPALDASNAGDDAELVYWRWYSNDTGVSPNADTMNVFISDDNGSTWDLLEQVTENTNEWTEARFALDGLVDLTDQIRVRFVASDFGDGSIVEAGVDDLRIVSVGCPTHPADINGDGSLNFFDVSEFLSLFGQQDPRADFNNDGSWNFFDVSAFLAAFGG